MQDNIVHLIRFVPLPFLGIISVAQGKKYTLFILSAFISFAKLAISSRDEMRNL